MKFDTEGTYTLQYRAVDECGNETTEDREVIVANPRTVLYTDGTLIINELPKDKASNEALHGAATNVYNPLDPNGSDVDAYDFQAESGQLWKNERSAIKSVEIGSAISPINTSWWFAYCNQITQMDLHLLDTSNVTSMVSMFRGTTHLTSLDVSNFDTSNVTNMNNMFQGCYVLSSLDLSSFNTSNVTMMASMFESCYVLTSLNVSSFDVRKVTTMQYMFRECKAISSLDLSSFVTSELTNMVDMFYRCNALTQLNISNFDTRKVTSMKEAFLECKALTSLDVSSFNTSSVTNMQSMFSNCIAITKIYASSNFVVDQVTNSADMFYYDQQLVGGAGTRWRATIVDKTYARIDGGTANPGYFTAKA